MTGQTKPKQENDVADRPSAGEQEIVPWAPPLPPQITPGMSLAECPTSLDRHDPRQRAWIFAAGNPADYQLEGRPELTIRAVHWLVYPDERTDEHSGEVSQYAVLVLFDSEGRFFKTTSEYAFRRLRAALDLYSRAEWDRGIAFQVRARPSRRHPGGTYHDIRICVGD